ncbi:iron complex transport system substrate-binding protein [Paenibacillus algorifonticola]|uniref:Iron complex transport system substrate-binding protein n=1 Tax=Paenibacillus algorifonticola TaxID=684063 RepID=A0A1I2HQ65_9BACL|nr:ABC transporter substrate-binding protein [Paenibacillus algorifonticola]SFF31698.1 iron complex transport system substrate-binding protein [Paenibacillus algorifonticola]
MKQLKTALLLVIIALLALVMAACSGNNGQGNTTATASPSASPEAAQSSSEPSATAADNVRTVASEKGEITIPANPGRVIGLSVVYPEFLQALGVTPIAVQNYHPEFPTYLEEPFKNTIKMGIATTPDFEKILAAAPDLIIAPIWWSDKDYDQLTKIAPTVLLPQRDDWRDELKDIAGVLGKPEAAEKVIQDLVVQELAAKEKLDTLVGDETVMYMMIMPDGIVLYGENIDRGSFVHKTLGLKAVENFPQSELSITISLEKLPEYNPDHIILQMNDDSNETIQQYYKEIQSSSLWKNMTAVKKNQVYLVGGEEWFNLGMSPMANSYAIDAVLQIFENKGQ